MAEYIEKGALKREARKLSTHLLNEWDTMGVLALIGRQPAADVVPVRHGHWISCKPYNPAFNGYECSECGAQFQGYRPDNYCGNCGAKMDGEDHAEKV